MITARWHPWKCQKYAESSPTSIHHLINVTGYHEISAEGIVLNLFAVLSWHVRRWNYCVSYCRLKCWNTWGIHNYWSMYGRINKWSHFIQSRLVGGLSLHYWPDNKNLIYILADNGFLFNHRSLFTTCKPFCAAVHKLQLRIIFKIQKRKIISYHYRFKNSRLLTVISVG